MERQIEELLKQNQELIKILQKKENPGNGKITVNFEKFHEDTENFDSYYERFEAYLDVQKIPEDQRAKVFISSLSPQLYQLLKNLLAPAIPSEQDLVTLKNVLKSHLIPKPLIIPARHKFLNRKQNEGESINSYMAELRALASNCEYKKDMLNIMLRDVFVGGLKDKMILDRLFEEDDIDLDKTLQIALAMERATKGANEVIGRSAGINALKIDKPKPQKFKNKVNHWGEKGNRKMYCTRCTNTDHTKENCKFINSKCHFCQKIGHVKKACFAAKQKQTHSVKQKQIEVLRDPEINTNQKVVPMFGIRTENNIIRKEEPKSPPILINVKIEDKICSMEVDTGGTVSVMSLKRFREISNKKYCPTNLVFRTYKGEIIVPLGYVTVKVEYKNQVLHLNLYLVKENLDTILGREWLFKIKFDWSAIKRLETSDKVKLDTILEEYKEVFNNNLGEIKNYEVKLELKPNVTPKFCRSRPVPFALQKRVEDEILRLEKEGIIERVENSEWATPVVPVVKPDGTIRLCADYSVTLNPNLVVPQHPLPHLEEIFSCLNGGKHFTKLDFSHAYLQMKVHSESQKLLTINTHKGLFVCKRLMYGLNGAPAIWQRYVDGLFQGLEGAKVFMDDARITGVDDKSHLETLKRFLGKCKEHGLKLNLKKSKFFQEEINFLGHKIDSYGLHKTDEKIAAIVKAPIPKNVQEVKSFLGLVNFYGKFCKNLATIANPLNRLTQKEVTFLWTKECQDAFDKIKLEICSPRVLIHYDPALPLTLATDASPVGVGCVLSHLLPDKTERPIAFASRTLTATEQKYSQIDKEALAIVWAVKKFYLYLKGRRFTLITDHQPLVAIFGSKKGLPTLTATRLLHYALALRSFEFDIIFRKTSDHGNADFLSRLPRSSEELDLKDEVSMFQLSQIETLPITAKELRDKTKTDPELGPLYQDLLEGQNLKGKEAQFSIEDGCIMYGQRVCIPKIYQPNVLNELHSGHLGMIKMKAIARSFVYWKNIDQDIEETARNCVDCAQHKVDPVKVKTHHWEYPSAPWERIHIDFAGPIYEHMFLIIVDAYTKWLEVYPLKSTTTHKTIECLRDCFSRFGLPVVIVSDNGSQFTSSEFQNFVQNNGIKHKTSAPFKPSSNGQAERYVFTLKQSLRAMQNYPGSIQQKLSTFLMQYRKAPNITTGYSPAELFLKRDIRTRINLLIPSLRNRVQEKIRKDNVEFQDRKFDIGDKVAIRDYRAANSKWRFGTIVNKDGALYYTINVQGILMRRHIDQIRSIGNQIPSSQIPRISNFPRGDFSSIEKTPEMLTSETPGNSSETPGNEFKETLVQEINSEKMESPKVGSSPRIQSSRPTASSSPGPLPRRSTRIRKAPKRLDL